LLLTYAKKVIEECYGDSICNTANHGPVLTKAEYIYGDSVANYTPVYIKVAGQLEIITVEELANKYGNNNWVKSGKQEKEFCELTDVETWTENGFTKLHRVIRHALAPHKKMMRIVTKSGLVDVTDDHSLLLKSGKEISPIDVVLNTELLHCQLKPFNNLSNISVNAAKLYGYFYSKGVCGKYLVPEIDTKANIWSLNNVPDDMVESYLSLCNEVYPQFEWNIIMRPQNKSKISLLTNNKELLNVFVNEYRTFMYNGKYKQIPAEIMNSNESIRRAFIEGFNDSKVTDIIRQIDVAQLYWMTSSIVDFHTESQVTQIDDIVYNGNYVFDLTTDNHHFAAGVGSIIVHNTDSVFFTFNLQTPEGKPIRGKEALEITIELAQEAGHLASSYLKGPHDLEYEKTFMPFCLLSKKRYVGMLYETDPNKCKRKEMGIVLKRRDNAPIVKDIYGGIIDILMKQQNIQQAIDFLKSSLRNLVEEKYPMDKLIITKSLRSGYKNPKSIAHKVLSDRITARDPGNKPSSGDRIAFAYIVTNNKKALQGEKIETPAYIRDNGLKLDYSFYITNQIMKPVQQVFALVLEKIWELQNKRGKILKFKNEVELLKKNTPEDKFEDKLEQLRNKEVKALLFDEYLRDINNTNQGNQSLMNFFVKK